MNEEMIGMNELTSAANVRAYAAEFLATMLFVLVGTGTVIAVGGFSHGDLASLVAIALAHGLGIGMMVYAVANISGGHLNPAVTLGMIVTKNVKIAPGVAYIVAQMAGAVVATGLWYVILFNSVGESVQFGAHGVNGSALGEGGALVLEIILTFVLVAVIFATAVSKKGFGIMAPLAIGLTIALIHLVAVPLTGASVNPARTFGPALISNAFDGFWLYILGPAIGAVLAAMLWHHIFLPAQEDD